MRKSFIATLALGALVIASCQKENDYAPKAESPVFTASFDTEAPADPDTKTQLVEIDGVKKSYWKSGDAIMVINGKGDGNVRAEYTTTDNGASATFKKTTEGSFSGTEFMALYPASPAGGATWKIGFPEYINGLWLTGTQTPKADSYDPQAHLAYARAVNNTFSFSNMVALLKFTVAETSKEVSSISVTVPAGEYVAGNFNFKVKDGDAPMEFYKDKGSTHLSTASLTGTFEAGKSYYLAVLPGDYSALTLSVNGKVFKTKAGKSTFKPNSIYNMGEINAVEGAKAIVMTIDKKNNWDNVYIYAWDSAGKEIFSAWPGTLVEGNTVTFPKSYYNANVNYILSSKITDNNTVQTKNQSQALTEDFSFTLPSDDKFFVCMNTTFTSYDNDYTATQVYAWFSDEEKITPNWPGIKLDDHPVYKYKYADFSYFSSPTYNFLDHQYFFILNNKINDSGQQTGNLKTGTDTIKKGTTNYRF